MNIINVTDLDNITDYDDKSPCNCTDSEYNIDIIIPVLLFLIPCGLSFLCLISLMIYTLIKPLLNKK